MVEQFTSKLPNAMTRQELIEEGKSEAEADQIMRERVFGAGCAEDAEGNVIERGHGSPQAEAKLAKRGIIDTPHKKAMALEAERKALKNGGATSDVIAAAVAAGVQAGLKAARDADL